MPKVVLRYGDLSYKNGPVQACKLVFGGLKNLGMETFIRVLSPPSEAPVKEVKDGQVPIYCCDKVKLLLWYLGKVEILFPVWSRLLLLGFCLFHRAPGRLSLGAESKVFILLGAEVEVAFPYC